MTNLINGLRRLLVFVASLALASMAIHIGADVASRYLFNAPLYGTIEIVKYYYMVAVTVLPLAAVAAAGQHVIVEVFTQHLRPAWQRGMDGFAALLTLIYLGVLCWASLQGAMSAYQIGEYQDLYLFDLPTWPMRWVFFFGVLGMALIFCMQLFSLLRGDGGTADESSSR